MLLGDFQLKYRRAKEQINMAHKLGKCRLCLKLGDFCSIFALDNDIQLSEMVMACSTIKVYDGDGLPDKICSDCVQKLSSAYIFKQQCERSDQELRRNYVPPPGINSSPTLPTNCSNSAFPTHTESPKTTPASRRRKRSVESDDSISSRSQERSERPGSSKRVEEPKKVKKPKRPRLSADSSCDDAADSSLINETNSDVPLLQNEFACPHCPKTFKRLKNMKLHIRNIHAKGNKALARAPEANVYIPKTSAKKQNQESNQDTEAEQNTCKICGKSFKFMIMLNHHQKTCQRTPAKSTSAPISSMKELVIRLQPIEARPQRATSNKPTCQYCFAHSKTVDNLDNNIEVAHAAIRKKPVDKIKSKMIICIFCSKHFENYYIYSSHFNSCPMKETLEVYQCPMCPKICQRAAAYLGHVRTHALYEDATGENGESEVGDE